MKGYTWGAMLWWRGSNSISPAFAMLLCTLALLLSPACTTIDERDVCCEDVQLIYRYVPLNKDAYKKNIQSMRHFLFDSEGVFVKEVPSNPLRPQRVRLRGLSTGTYTMVTIANGTEELTSLPELEPKKTRLSQFRVRALPDGVKHGTDELFWNYKQFDVRRGERHTYYCDLSNIHCHLTVRVKWEGLTPDAETAKYSMELQKVPGTYQLTPPFMPDIVILPDAGEMERTKSTFTQVVHSFPRNTGAEETYHIPARVMQLELQERFTTLRYTNEDIPVLRILKDGELYRREIDLKRAFRNWGLFPDAHSEQDYHILVLMKRDGSIVLHQWTGFRIVDWADGGTLGGSVN